jgi:hypothetical protein
MNPTTITLSPKIIIKLSKNLSKKILWSDPINCNIAILR